jgi:LysR family transcriptional regulator, transcriptional activator of nhaA
MDRLNYHHLLYFFTVAREGSIARASARLGLAQPTVSAQIHALEDELGRKLLERSGRGLKVTPAGEIVLRYAGSIFALGGNMLAALEGDHPAAPELSAGVSTSLPQPLIATLFREIFRSNSRPRVTIQGGASEALVTKVAAGELQFALTDAPPASAAARGVHSRALLQCTLMLFATPALARKLSRGFPARMATVRVLMHSEGALREAADRWLGRAKLEINIAAEMPNPEFYAAAAGAATFAPSLEREWLRRVHGLVSAGELKGSRWRAFLVTAKGDAHLPAVEAIVSAAKQLS